MKTPARPCSCGQAAVLCYHNYTTSFNGTNGSSVSETIRFYRYICPHCFEWGRPSCHQGVAKRNWNALQKKATRNRFEKADFLLTWRCLETGEIVCRPKTSPDGNSWGVF